MLRFKDKQSSSQTERQLCKIKKKKKKNLWFSILLISSRRLFINFMKLKDCQPFPVALADGFYAKFYLWALLLLSAACICEPAFPFSLAFDFFLIPFLLSQRFMQPNTRCSLTLL